MNWISCDFKEIMNNARRIPFQISLWGRGSNCEEIKFHCFLFLRELLLPLMMCWGLFHFDAFYPLKSQSAVNPNHSRSNSVSWYQPWRWMCCCCWAADRSVSSLRVVPSSFCCLDRCPHFIRRADIRSMKENCNKHLKEGQERRRRDLDLLQTAEPVQANKRSSSAKTDKSHSGNELNKRFDW